MERAVALLGIVVLLGIGWSCSTDRRAIRYGPIGIALLLQLGIAVLALRTPWGERLLEGANDFAVGILAAADEGTAFVFGVRLEITAAAKVPPVFALRALPIVIFTASLSSVLYHWGLLQGVVRLFAVVLRRSMRLSGAESLATAANVFLSMTDAPLLIRPYVARLTRSELFCVMTAGLSTVAGAVFFAYVELLGSEYTGYLLAASFMSAPAAIAMAKLMVPEVGAPETLGHVPRHADAKVAPRRSSVIRAAADGAQVGVEVAIAVGAMLIAFIGLVALVNSILGWSGGLLGYPDLSLQGVLGLIMNPLAWLMGVPWHDASVVGELLSKKLVLNELVAYQDLAVVKAGLEERSVVIASFALCGFANLGSLAILIGGLGKLAPERRDDVVRDGLRAVAAGSLATILTGAVAGLVS